MHNFPSIISVWYKKNQRDLPWRMTTDPYKIWVSEIILQQTRVNQGINYYIRFIESFPDIKSLAQAKEDDVLKHWQGLGYYSRARNMHVTARHIWNNLNGIFPDNYSDILALKGVGPYTAAIVASIAFGQSCPAVDGNVFRLLARYFGIRESLATGKGKKEFLRVATEIMPAKHPGIHNQAMMEFGALQCTPKSPNCLACPLSLSCYAFNHQSVESFPVKFPKVKQRTRYFYYYFIKSKNRTWLEKRTGNDIWKNLFQFPLLESTTELTDSYLTSFKPHFLEDCPVNLKSISPTIKHVLSHQIILARLIYLETETSCQPGSHYIPIETHSIQLFAIPRLIEKLIEKARIPELNSIYKV